MAKTRKWLKASVLIETLGVIVITTGIGFECVTREPLGLLIITVGSLIIAIGSGIMIKARGIWKK